MPLNTRLPIIVASAAPNTPSRNSTMNRRSNTMLTAPFTTELMTLMTGLPAVP